MSRRSPRHKTNSWATRSTGTFVHAQNGILDTKSSDVQSIPTAPLGARARFEGVLDEQRARKCQLTSQPDRLRAETRVNAPARNGTVRRGPNSQVIPKYTSQVEARI